MKSAISSGKYLHFQQNSHLGTKYSYKSMQVHKTCKIQTNILQEKKYKASIINAFWVTDSA